MKKTIEAKRLIEKQKIWNKKEKAKKLVPEQFHKQIYVFGKKASKQIPIRKIQDYAIDLKKELMLKKKNICLSSQNERKEVREFI